MSIATIKSRPLYAPLVAATGSLHLMLADADGVSALLDLAQAAPPGFFERAHIMLVCNPSASDAAIAQIAGLCPDLIYQAPSLAAALPRLAHALNTAHMGTRLYLAGSEGLIGQATKLALEAGMDQGSIQAEHRGTLARRVQCVHCKGISEDVRTQPCICAHCGLTLLVRDHYSRRIAAFQGVCIDAEEPGIVPDTADLFR
jgi:hypothetical protein